MTPFSSGAFGKRPHLSIVIRANFPEQQARLIGANVFAGMLRPKKTFCLGNECLWSSRHVASLKMNHVGIDDGSGKERRCFAPDVAFNRRKGLGFARCAALR